MTDDSAPQHQTDPRQAEQAADDQPTVRLDQGDPDATRPMSLADLLNSD
ncbi:hypothetical protein [Dactylosporangium sp. NPDC000521]